MYILGVSCYYHDAAAALLQHGQLVAAAEEERFSRIKHDPGYPASAIRFCLETANITADDLDYVVFYEKPLLKFERILTTSAATFPRSGKAFREAALAWLSEKLWIGTKLAERIGVPRRKILFSEHHLSHAASCFLCSPFDEAAILTVDGVGEWATTTVCRGAGTRIELLRQINFPHSLGLLYSAFTAFLGFQVNDGEYKVMGMAPYGKPRFRDKMERLLRVGPDSAFELDLDYFSFHYSDHRTFSQRFVQLWGQPRLPEEAFFTPASGFPKYLGTPPANFAELAGRNQHYARADQFGELVPGRRRGAEQRGQRPDSARNAFPAALRAAFGGRRRRRVGSGPVRLSLRAGPTSALRAGACVLGAGVFQRCRR